MHQITDRAACTGCGCCVTVCPVSCISMMEDSEGFSYPSINHDVCLECGRCTALCPANAPYREDAPIASFYMAQHKDDGVLARCSSGGVFDALAELTLRRGGVVIGAVRSPKTGRVEHVAVEDAASLSAMRVSKYDQSSAWDSYTQVRHLLKDHRSVLFTGTPCQISGLYASLGPSLSSSRSLITMEVLCHGVTCSKTVQLYLKSRSKRLGANITDVRFRTKEGRWGWEDSSHAVLMVEDGKGVKIVRDVTDTFMYGYIRNLYLRESCYRCKYCSIARRADFMAGDYWGIANGQMPRSQVRKGVSLLAVTGSRAESELSQLRELLSIVPIDSKDAMRLNGALSRPASRPAYRDDFFNELAKGDFASLMMSRFRLGVYARMVKSMLGPKMAKLLGSVVHPKKV